jgi:hypothetical protein
MFNAASILIRSFSVYLNAPNRENRNRIVSFHRLFARYLHSFVSKMNMPFFVTVIKSVASNSDIALLTLGFENPKLVCNVKWIALAPVAFLFHGSNIVLQSNFRPIRKIFIAIIRPAEPN